MLFSSVLFLVWFLPLTFGVSFLLRKRSMALRNLWLLAASLFFYGWAAPWWLLLILSDCLIAFYGTKWMDSRTGRIRKGIFIFCLVFVIGLLFFFKYWNFFAIQIESLSGMGFVIREIVLPAGISFYTFQVISYLADVYTRKVRLQTSLLRFCLYVAMFFQLIAGPIVRYSDIEGELGNRKATADDYAQGVSRFLCGLSKKVLLANPLSAIYVAYRASANPTVLYAWIAALSVTLMIYFDFSGYSDMAIGLGRLWGFHLPENFRYPFTAGSFSEFWRRWHMSLTGWFRDYVYIPLGGNRQGTAIQIRNLFLIWLLTGLWHGAAWTFVVWGLLFFVLLTAEKFLIPAGVQKSFFYRIVVGILIILSFVLFYDVSLGQFGADLQILFGLAGLPFSSPETWYVLQSSLLLLAAGCLGSTPFFVSVCKKMKEKRGWRLILPVLGWLALLICLASLAAKTSNPFLYFQF